MKLIRHALAAGFAVAAISAVACSSQHGSTGSGPSGNGTVGINGQTGQDGTGQVGMHLTLSPGVTLTSVSWTISGPNAYSGTVQIGDAESLEFVAGGILAGSGYTVTITGTDSSGDPCTGTSAPFSITAGAVTQAVMVVTCTAPGTAAVNGAKIDSGSVEVDAGLIFATSDAGVFNCPGISAFSISPAEINLSGTATITVARAPLSSTIAYTVSPAGGGTFTTSTLGTPSAFKCSGTAAQVTVTATVTSTDTATAAACVGQPFQSISALVNCEFGDASTVVPDSGTTPPDSGTTADTGTTPDTGTTASCVPVCDPANDPQHVCTQGLTTGSGGATCNATEQLFFAHDQGTATAGDCLRCVLNGGCLDDAQGDVGPDCTTLTGTVPASASAGAGTSLQTDCQNLLSCELTSKCALSNPLDCYCGLNVDSNTCKTTQTGACIPQVQIGLESTDPTFIENNFSATANGNGGAVADKIITCARNNCPSFCF